MWPLEVTLCFLAPTLTSVCFLLASTITTTLNSMFCTLYNVYYTHPTIHCIMLTVHITLNITLYTVYWTLNKSHSMQYNVHCTYQTLHYLLCTIYYTLFPIHFSKHRSSGQKLSKSWFVRQRQKYIGSAGALLPGKFLRVRKVFTLNILLSNISWTCLENHWRIWKVSGLSGKFSDCIERFWIVWKVFILSGNFQYSLESIEGLENLKIFWQVTKLSRRFSECLENYHIAWKVSR